MLASLAARPRLRSDSRNAILKLPQEVLAKILAALDKFSLARARLACRGFRAASIQCLTSLSFDCNSYLSIREKVFTAQGVLSRRLHVVTALTCLSLSIKLPARESLLQVPGVLPVLRNLNLFLEMHRDQAACHCLEAIIPLLAEATCLTSVTVGGYASHADFPDQLADALRVCPALEELTLDVFSSGLSHYGHRLAEAVLCAPALRRICVLRGIDSSAPFWGTLLNSSIGKTRLQSLEGVLMNGSEVGIQQLAALTELTRLDAEALEWQERDHWPAGTTELSKLSALKELQLVGPPLSSNELQAQLRPMTQLQRLDLFEWDGDMAAWDSLLACRTALTALTVGCYTPPVLHLADFNPNAYANLRILSADLSIANPGDILRLCAAVTGLERLELVIPSSWKSVVQRFPPMPLLTHLELTSNEDAEQRGPARPAARFLARLPRLKDLQLESVLDVEHWGKDSKYVARLTDLTNLRLVLVVNDDQQPVPLSSAELKPLTALVRLQSLMISSARPNATLAGLWDLRHAREFTQALQSAQQRVGFPLIKFRNYRGQKLPFDETVDYSARIWGGKSRC